MRARMMARSAIAIVATLMATQAGAANKAPALGELTPADFAQRTSVADDALDTKAEINSLKGYTAQQGLLRMVNDDAFLRAFVDKKTGATAIQVYQYVYYSGDWRFYYAVNYETTAGPAEGVADRIGSKVVDCSGSRYGGCTLREDVGFVVTESLLRQIAATYQPNPAAPPMWRFKLKAKNGTELVSALPVAEIAGFLQVLDRYRTDRGLTPVEVRPAS